MIQYNNNLGVLPFYADIEEQNHRRSYAYGQVYPLYTPMGSVPPFNFVIPHVSATISTVRVYRLWNGTSYDVKSIMQARGLQKVNYSGKGLDVIEYPSIAPHNITQEEGQHYLRITLSNGAVYYSDIFTVVGDLSGYLCLTWYDLSDFVMDNAVIAFGHGYRNTLYLNTQLGKPEYEFNEEGENRDGFFFPEKQISEKKYKCQVLAPEYLCDVMRFIRLSDIVEVLDQYGHRYNTDTFLITPKWETQGDIASVEIEFTCDTVAKKIGLAVTGNLGDYNNDYNNDYDT